MGVPPALGGTPIPADLLKKHQSLDVLELPGRDLVEIDSTRHGHSPIVRTVPLHLVPAGRLLFTHQRPDHLTHNIVDPEMDVGPFRQVIPNSGFGVERVREVGK